MEIRKMIERDSLLTHELNLKALSRLIGYSESGEPVEIVFDSKEQSYFFQVGGEYVKEASQQSIEMFVPAVQ